MDKAVDYVVIEDDSPFNLENRVKTKIRDGWSLAGGIAIAYHEESWTTFYCQAVYKVENDKAAT